VICLAYIYAPLKWDFSLEIYSSENIERRSPKMADVICLVLMFFMVERFLFWLSTVESRWTAIKYSARPYNRLSFFASYVLQMLKMFINLRVKGEKKYWKTQEKKKKKRGRRRRRWCMGFISLYLVSVQRLRPEKKQIRSESEAYGAEEVFRFLRRTFSESVRGHFFVLPWGHYFHLF
jgi:hypothetical protein